MTPPTPDEIKRAIDGITVDGPVAAGGKGSTVTNGIILACVASPLILESLATKLTIIEALIRRQQPPETAPGTLGRIMMDELFRDAEKSDEARNAVIESLMLSITAYGMNIGMRISEARAGVPPA